MPIFLRASIFLALTCLALLTACGGQAKEPVVARVNGRDVTLQEFDAHAAFVGVSTDAANLAPELRRALTEDLIRRALVLSEAHSRGLDVSEQELAKAEHDLRQGMSESEFLSSLARQGIDMASWREELKRRLTVAKTLDLVLAAQAQVTPAEITAYYQANRDEFHRPEQVLAQHALLPSRKLAQTLVDRVHAGEDLAEASADLGAPLPDGGQPAWLSRGHMPPDLENRIFRLQPGKLAGPLDSPYGFHVVRVVDKRPPLSMSLAQAAAKIQRRLLAERREELGDAWVDEMLKKADLWINQGFISTGQAG